MKKLAAVLVLAVAAGSALAQQAMKPEDMIMVRKAGLGFMSWNMGKIKANIDGSFNKEQTVAAANVVAATAASDLFSLFVPGTDKEVGGQKTRAKPELFAQPDKLKEFAMALEKETSELAKVAASGDVAAIKTQFGATGKACKNCHDEFRAD
jgi:cytochrome c556